jgi:ADP-heptose:LPS heptosyltransferase
VGEFGWELMNWQAFLRQLSTHYEKTIVCCRPTSRMLYSDFCADYVFHTISGDANCHMAHHIRNLDEVERVMALKPGDADCVFPRKYIPASAQHFVRFGERCKEVETDVLVHARNRSSFTDRNWSLSKWNAFIAQLRDADIRVGSIGLSGSTMDLDGVQDYRDTDLAEAANIIASSRLVVGPSSGPLHLSALCGTPQLVWTNQGRYMMGKTSREKYETWWNPLKTQVCVLDDGFDPPADRVVSHVQKLLARRSDKIPGAPIFG